LGLWIGAQDELFDPQKVIAFAMLIAQKKKESLLNIIPQEEHLSILITAHYFKGKWILDTGQMLDNE